VQVSVGRVFAEILFLTSARNASSSLLVPVAVGAINKHVDFEFVAWGDFHSIHTLCRNLCVPLQPELDDGVTLVDLSNRVLWHFNRVNLSEWVEELADVVWGAHRERANQTSYVNPVVLLPSGMLMPWGQGVSDGREIVLLILFVFVGSGSPVLLRLRSLNHEGLAE